MLLADMGTGKTIITETSIVDTPAPTLVIAPKRVAALVWEQESRLWEHTCRLNVRRALGPPASRAVMLEAPADIHVINIENTQWLVENYDLTRWQRIVLDELSLWGGGGKRWKAIRKKLEHAQVIGLTGTPASNGLLKVWPMAELIRPRILGRSRDHYKRRYFYPTDYMQYSWAPLPFAEQQIFEALEPITLRIENNLAEMPELLVQPIRVPLPDEAHRLMRDLTRDYMAELDGEELTAATAGVLTGKLQQVANGRIYVETGMPGDRRSKEVHRAKIDTCRELVEELAGAPVIIAYNYQHDLLPLREAWPEAPVIGEGDDEALTAAWLAGEVPVMLGHPGAFGHGLNLQKGPGHHLIWYGPNWSLDYFDQTVARLWRSGQQAGTVFVHVLIGAETIDEDIFQALHDKAAVQGAMLDYFARVTK